MKTKTLIFTIFLLNIIIANSLNVCVDSSNFKCPQFRALIDEIDKIHTNQTQNQIPKAIRLAFHDCVSGCNGCVDMDAEDNKGLQCILGNSRRVHRNHKNKIFFGKFIISRGDIIALLAQRAIYLSSNHKGLTVPFCDFKFGRKDCNGPQENKEIFGKSHGNWTQISDFFHRNFNFTTQEIIALMGAHALGNNHANFSGHTGPWVEGRNRVFTNQYYINLLNKNKTLDYKVHLTEAGKSQWRSSVGDKSSSKPKMIVKTMLNTDMCLLKNFNTDSKGKPDCTYNSCQTNDERNKIIETYANSEPTFKKDFGAVFQKLIEHRSFDLVDPENPVNKQNEFENYEGERIITSIMQTHQNEPIKNQFKTYLQLFNKKYDINSEEGIKRFKIFKKNLEFIKEQNALKSEKYGFNKFTDCTIKEYRNFITGEDPALLDGLVIKENDHLLKNA